MWKLRTELNSNQSNFENRGPDQSQNNFEIIRPDQDQFKNLAVHGALFLTTPALSRSKSFFSKCRLLTPSRISRTDHAVLTSGNQWKRLDFIFRIYLISVEHVNIFFICARFSTWPCSCLCFYWIQRSFWFLFGPRCRMVVKVAVGLSPWNCFICLWRWWFWMNLAPQTSHLYFRSWPCAWTERNNQAIWPVSNHLNWTPF